MEGFRELELGVLVAREEADGPPDGTGRVEVRGVCSSRILVRREKAGR